VRKLLYRCKDCATEEQLAKWTASVLLDYEFLQTVRAILRWNQHTSCCGETDVTPLVTKMEVKSAQFTCESSAWRHSRRQRESSIRIGDNLDNIWKVFSEYKLKAPLLNSESHLELCTNNWRENSYVYCNKYISRVKNVKDSETLHFTMS
jgi:hypothetical protein